MHMEAFHDQNQSHETMLEDAQIRIKQRDKLRYAMRIQESSIHTNYFRRCAEKDFTAKLADLTQEL